MEGLYILVDKTGVVCCIASLQENLHKDKIDAGMTKVHLTEDEHGSVIYSILIGDEYDLSTGKISIRPDRHIISEQEKTDAKIEEEMRLMAIERLITKKQLPVDYLERKG